MSIKLKHYYDVGEKVIFKKSGRVCTVIGYYEQYYKLQNHKGRLIITPDCGIQKIQTVEEVQKPVVHRVRLSSVKFSDNVSQAEVVAEVKEFVPEIPNETTLPIVNATYPAIKEEKPKLKKARAKAVETKAEAVNKSKTKSVRKEKKS